MMQFLSFEEFKTHVGADLAKVVTAKSDYNTAYTAAIGEAKSITGIDFEATPEKATPWGKAPIAFLILQSLIGTADSISETKRAWAKEQYDRGVAELKRHREKTTPSGGQGAVTGPLQEMAEW